MPDEFIIKVLFGGLGDHLFLSHLPRIAKESGGFKRVYISNLSEYRNIEYKDFVWGSNPHVDGFTDQDAPYPLKMLVDRGNNVLDQVMLLRGLDDGLRYHEPELYIKPPIIESLRDKVVFDPNYISNVGQFESAHVEKFFAKEGITPDYMLALRPKGVSIEKYGAILTTESLMHYCSVIVSARKFICFSSGGATLAAALGVPAIVLWGPGQHGMFHHSRLHRYVNVNPQSFPRKAWDYLTWRYRYTRDRLKEKV